MLDTRQHVRLLLDHKIYYGHDKGIDDAINLIRDISSLTLINYISGFAVNLYLNENGEHSGKVQAYLVDSLVGKAGEDGIKRWLEVIKIQIDNGHAPVLLWSYSNLLFYTLIFKTFNHLPSRDLSGKEAQSVIDAYLIINSSVNRKISIDEGTLKEAAVNNNLEEILIPQFIYQKDYASSTDFTNQVTRGYYFFQYLESHPKYGKLVKEYYGSKNTSGYKRMFKNLLVLFTELKISTKLKQRSQLANLYDYFIGGEIDLHFIETLCINSEIADYAEDHNFRLLRRKFLFRINHFEFFILDVNFLLDQFYKAQVFEFHTFLKSKKVKGDFLSIKAKEFMEGIYLASVINNCFPHYVKFIGDLCKDSNGEELCDVYLRDKNKLCLIEFKDVLLNANVKNSADKSSLFDEFDKKFVANQKGDAKGITQLIRAVNDINEHSIVFDPTAPEKNLEIYPVVLYTDYTFGIEGLNKVYKAKFQKELDLIKFTKGDVKDVTFINLNFLEIRENYLQKKLLDLFIMLDCYHKHTNTPDGATTNFEVFSSAYMKEYVSENLGTPASYRQVTSQIIAAK